MRVVWNNINNLQKSEEPPGFGEKICVVHAREWSDEEYRIDYEPAGGEGCDPMELADIGDQYR